MFEEQVLESEETVSTASSSIENAANEDITSVNSAVSNSESKSFKGVATFDYDNTPIVDIVNDIIVDGVKRGSSDIHFDPYESGIHVRIRIDGELHDYTDVPLAMKKNMISASSEIDLS